MGARVTIPFAGSRFNQTLYVVLESSGTLIYGCPGGGTHCERGTMEVDDFGQ